MKSTIGFLMVFLFPILLLASNSSSIATKQFTFYSETFSISYDKELVKCGKKMKQANEKSVKSFYKEMEAAPYQQLLNQLQKEKDRMQLNDWLYSKMVRLAIEEIYPGKNEMQLSLAWWFLLCKSGYDIRLANYDYVEMYLYVPTSDQLAKVPFFTEEDQRFYNLSTAMLGIKTKGRELKKHKFKGNGKGQKFSFQLQQMPNLKPIKSYKSFDFVYKEKEVQFKVQIDENMLNILNEYPALDEMGYLEASLSPTLKNSLIPQLEKMMAGKSQKESLEVLAAFTRTAFEYKWDWDVYNDDHPMFAEQVFHSEFSDHEDRCALYYFLVKEMLDLPMVVISHYNNNMTLGVAIDEKMKREFDYNGKKFVICDPTHPTSTCEIGRYPNGLTKTTATVLGER